MHVPFSCRVKSQQRLSTVFVSFLSSAHALTLLSQLFSCTGSSRLLHPLLITLIFDYHIWMLHCCHGMRNKMTLASDPRARPHCRAHCCAEVLSEPPAGSAMETLGGVMEVVQQRQQTAPSRTSSLEPAPHSEASVPLKPKRNHDVQAWKFLHEMHCMMDICSVV